MFDYISIAQAYPRLSIIALALIFAFFTTLINYFVLDKERMREIKTRQKSLQQEMKKHQTEGNHEKMLNVQKEIMSHSMEMMRHSFKPMLITIVPVLVFFSFIRGLFAETVITGSWFWYYFFGALVGSIIFRKLFRLP